MDSPQYINKILGGNNYEKSFKPYYKWIVLNTLWKDMVLTIKSLSFKPYYKWIVLNTEVDQNNEISRYAVF